MDNLHHLCIGFDNWTQVGFDSEDPKFSFGARQLEKGARRCSSYYFIYNFSKTRCSNGVDCRIFKWISPFEDRKYLSKNKSL